MAFGRPTSLPNQDLSIRNTSSSCVQLENNQIILSRTTLVASLTVLIFLLCLTLLATFILLYREITRRRQHREAKNWGRRSRFVHRISTIRKEVDDSFTRQYQGCYVSERPENPEMGSESPVEMGYAEQKIWEAPAVPAKVEVRNGGARKSKVGSLFFDTKVGLWMPKR